MWWLRPPPHFTYSLLLDDVAQGGLDQRILPDEASPHDEKFVFILYRCWLSVGIAVHAWGDTRSTDKVKALLMLAEISIIYIQNQFTQHFIYISEIIAFIVFISRKETKPIGLDVTKCHKPFNLYWWYFTFSEYGCDGNHQGRNPTLSTVKKREGEVSDHKKIVNLIIVDLAIAQWISEEDDMY